MSTITEMVAPFTKVPNINQTATFESDTSVFLNEINSRYIQGNTQVEQINVVAGELNAINGNVNTAYSNTIIAKNATEGFRDEAETARDEAVGAVASLPAGIINDGTISATDAWSSSKIDSELDAKQDTLVNQTNIKSINGTSLLGSGNLVTPDTTYGNATSTVAGLVKVRLNGTTAYMTFDGSDA